MKVSIEQVREVLRNRTAAPLDATQLFTKDLTPSHDAVLIREIRDQIMAMPEVREEIIQELKARIERGEYQVTSESIVDSMIRREIADKLR